MWWAKDPDRLKQEVAAVDALREHGSVADGDNAAHPQGPEVRV